MFVLTKAPKGDPLISKISFLGCRPREMHGEIARYFLVASHFGRYWGLALWSKRPNMMVGLGAVVIRANALPVSLQRFHYAVPKKLDGGAVQKVEEAMGEALNRTARLLIDASDARGREGTVRFEVRIKRFRGDVHPTRQLVGDLIVLSR